MQTLIPSIIEQKVTGQEAFAGYRSLVHRYGERAPGPGEELKLWVPPDAATVRMIPSWAWLELHVDPARSRALVTAARVAERRRAHLGARPDADSGQAAQAPVEVLRSVMPL